MGGSMQVHLRGRHNAPQMEKETGYIRVSHQGAQRGPDTIGSGLQQLQDVIHD